MWQSGIPASKADRLRLEVLQRGGRLPSEVETRSIAAAALKHRRALVALRHVLHLRRSRLPHEHPPTLERTGGTPRLHGFPSWTFSLIAKSALRISSAAFWVLMEISHCAAASSAAMPGPRILHGFSRKITLALSKSVLQCKPTSNSLQQ